MRFSRRRFLGRALASAFGAGLVGNRRLLGGDFGGASIPPQAVVPNPLRPRVRSYRTLGRTGFKVSDIGFGGGSLTNANVLAAALDAGVNYIDTAEHYSRGGSERAVGEALQGRDRDALFITTKLNLKFGPSTTKEDLRARFAKSLERMKTGRADCLMIHACEIGQVGFEPYHALIRELKAEGKVRFSGLSSHGSDYAHHGPAAGPMDEVFLAAAEDGRFDVGLFVYNFLKAEMGEKILKACGAKGMGMTLMKTNPVKSLATEQRILKSYEERAKAQGKDVPDSVIRLRAFTQDRQKRMEAFMNARGLAGPDEVRDAAIRYCLSHPGVHSVCPSLNAMEDVDAYVALSGTKAETGDPDLLAGYGDACGDLYCRHACGVCEPACPSGVPINAVLRFLHYYGAQGLKERARLEYAALGRRDAAPCAGCAGPCFRACPHGVPAPGLLALAHATLAP
jgi:predicted aldo/keto reductase-like oxidoreductase